MSDDDDDRDDDDTFSYSSSVISFFEDSFHLPENFSWRLSEVNQRTRTFDSLDWQRIQEQGEEVRGGECPIYFLEGVYYVFKSAKNNSVECTIYTTDLSASWRDSETKYQWMVSESAKTGVMSFTGRRAYSTEISFGIATWMTDRPRRTHLRLELLTITEGVLLYSSLSSLFSLFSLCPLTLTLTHPQLSRSLFSPLPKDGQVIRRQLVLVNEGANNRSLITEWTSDPTFRITVTADEQNPGFQFQAKICADKLVRRASTSAASASASTSVGASTSSINAPTSAPTAASTSSATSAPTSASTGATTSGGSSSTSSTSTSASTSGGSTSTPSTSAASAGSDVYPNVSGLYVAREPNGQLTYHYLVQYDDGFVSYFAIRRNDDLVDFPSWPGRWIHIGYGQLRQMESNGSDSRWILHFIQMKTPYKFEGDNYDDYIMHIPNNARKRSELQRKANFTLWEVRIRNNTISLYDDARRIEYQLDTPLSAPVTDTLQIHGGNVTLANELDPSMGFQAEVRDVYAGNRLLHAISSGRSIDEIRELAQQAQQLGFDINGAGYASGTTNMEPPALDHAIGLACWHCRSDVLKLLIEECGVTSWRNSQRGDNECLLLKPILSMKYRLTDWKSRGRMTEASANELVRQAIRTINYLLELGFVEDVERAQRELARFLGEPRKWIFRISRPNLEDLQDIERRLRELRD